MVPTSSRFSSPAHPSPPSAPAATVRPRRLPRAVVGGALSAGLLTITRPYRAIPYVTVDGGEAKAYRSTDTAEAQLVWDRWGTRGS